MNLKRLSYQLINSQHAAPIVDIEYANLIAFYSDLTICDNQTQCLLTTSGSIPYWLKDMRYFTVEECLRLMGYYNGEIKLPHTHQSYGAIGNGVSPSIVEYLTNILLNQQNDSLIVQNRIPFLF